jgi:excinuclease ABC subunit C
MKSLPDSPGVYQYFNVEKQLIYVGKAKSLKKRVSSYFNKEQHDNAKTAVMVRHIVDIKYILTETEFDALLLENNLIKKHQPRYNVLLKDDKTYPWIVLRKENFPRVYYTRTKVMDGSTYFGPYSSVKMINTLLDLIHQLYKLRTCNLNLNEDSIAKQKFKVCLEYQIGNCKGPCEAHQSETEYNENIEQIKHILKGNIQKVIQHLAAMMNKLAVEYKFEDANIVKNKIELLEGFKSKSVVVSPSIHNVDVITIVSEQSSAFANYMKIINGSIIQSQTLEIKKKLDETNEELIALAITEMRTRHQSNAKEILVNVMPDVEVESVTFTAPKIGEKRHLVLLSEKNARYFMRDKLEQYDKLNPEHQVERLLTKMKDDLRLSVLPHHIECFDNSNFQGTDAVGAMSVFKDGRASKKDYRHFNIETVEGPDDFASMREVIFRRYSRLLQEEQPLPQLIIIDGGKGQLSAALSSLEKLNLRGKIGIIGIAKKLEEIFYPDDPLPLYLDKKSDTLRIIQQLRDEVHRFGITHHRKKRSKAFIKSELEQIKGIGKNTAAALIHEYKSVKKIREATLEQLTASLGKAKAKILTDYFNQAKK